jgi:transposase
MRNVAVAVCRQLGFGGQAVAAVFGLTENYVATLHNRALREGLPGIVRDSGRPRKLSERDWARARQWRAAGASEEEIAARLGVNQSTVSRHLAGTGVQQQLPAPEPEAAGPGRAEPTPAARTQPGPAPAGAGLAA